MKLLVIPWVLIGWLLFALPVWASQPAEIKINQPAFRPLQFQTQVWASVGDYLYDIDGYTAPNAKVHLVSSQRTVEATTFADKQGHFVFHRLLSHRQPGMFCFFQEYQGLSSPPLCLWPPLTGRQRRLQGVLLPPLVSLHLSQQPGQATYLFGWTIPNSQLALLQFRHRHWWDFLRLSLTSRAAPLIKADNHGYFRLPLGKTGWGRVVVGSRFRQSLTPPSYNLAWRGWNIGVWLRQQLAVVCQTLCHWPLLWFLELIVLVGLVGHVFRKSA